jgi:glycosyltransferase involved in cell wall biosynthesis
MPVPAVSVIVPLHQKAPYVARAVRSVLAQTFADFELIVVDDGSTDGGGEMAAAAGDDRTRIVRMPHGGEGAARNRGLAEACAEWAAFLDADDEWRPRFLERAMGLARARDGLAAVFTNVLRVSQGRPLLGAVAHEDGVVLDYFRVVLENDGIGMTSSSTLARRSVLIGCGAFAVGVPLGADGDAWARLAWTGRVGYVSEALAVYHDGTPGSASVEAPRRPPVFPVLVHSYRRWEAAGRVAGPLRESSRRVAESLLLSHVVALLHWGDKQRAWALLRNECPARPSSRYVGVCLRATLPTPILHLLASTKARWRGRFDTP